MTRIDDLLTDLGHRARTLEPRPADVASILAAAGADRAGASVPATRRTRRALVPSAALAAAAALVALPATRTAVGGAVDRFFGGHAPGHEVSGRPLTGREVPRWMRSDRGVLVVAGRGRDRLVASREGRDYCFAYGTGVGECGDRASWARELADHPVVLRGPTSALGRPRGALYGFTRGDVVRVRFSFAQHRPVIVSARNGGFAIPTDERRPPRQLDLLDGEGRVIARIDLGDRFDLYR